MRARVEPQVDSPSRLVDTRDEPILECALVADERDHGAMMVGVEVHVEHLPARRRERRRDCVDGGAIPAFGQVRYRLEQQHPAYPTARWARPPRPPHSGAATP